jgi:hypothetical protein
LTSAGRRRPPSGAAWVSGRPMPVSDRTLATRFRRFCRPSAPQFAKNRSLIGVPVAWKLKIELPEIQ